MGRILYLNNNKKKFSGICIQCHISNKKKASLYIESEKIKIYSGTCIE